MCRFPRHRCEPAWIPNVRIDGDNGGPVEQCEASCLNSLQSQLNRNEPTPEQIPCSQWVQAEYFVDASVAAKYLSCSRKHLLRLSDRGLIPAHPLPGSAQRRTWRYLLSELRSWMLNSTHTNDGTNHHDGRTISSGGSRKGGH
jgi:hypothetical protein